MYSIFKMWVDYRSTFFSGDNLGTNSGDEQPVDL